MASYPAEPKDSPAAGGPEAKFDNPASIHSHPMHPDDNVTTRTVQCVEPGCTLRAVPGGGNLCSRHRPRQPKNPRPRNKCTHPGCTRPQAFVGDTCAQHRPAHLAPPAGHHRSPAALLDEAHERLRRARRSTVRQPGLDQTDPPRRHASDAAEHMRILGMAERQERDNDRSWELEKRRQERRAARSDAGGAAEAPAPVLVGAMHRQGHPYLPDEEGSQLKRTDNKPKDKKDKKGGTKKRRSRRKRRTRKRRSKRRRRTRR